MREIETTPQASEAPKNGSIVLGALASIALLGGSLFHPQDAEGQAVPTESFVEQVQIQLVNVEIWVTDKQGRFVPGLTADDFVVLHDGEPVAIEYFSQVQAENRVSPVQGPTPSAVDVDPGTETNRPQNHLVVYFDDLNLHPGNRTVLVDNLRSFLAREGPSPERVLILRQDRSLYVEAPFGSNADQLAAALDNIEAAGAEGASLATDTDQAMQEIRSLWNSSQETAGSAATGLAGVPQGAPITTIPGAGSDNTPSGAVGGTGGIGGLAPSPCEVFTSRVEPLLESYYHQRSAQIRTTLERLSEAVTFLSGLEGVKTLMYLGDRLETAPAAGLTSYAVGFCPTDHGNLLMNAQTEDLSQLMTEVARHASANRVTIYGIQGRGVRSRRTTSAADPGREFRGAGGFEGAAKSNQQGGFLLLSAETGGRAVLNTSDFDAAFRSIQEERVAYYSIAYRPPVSANARFHTIEVQTNRDDLTTRHRKGYREKSSDEQLSERVLGALNLGLTSNPLSLRLGAGAITLDEGDRFTLPLRIRVPIREVTFVGGEDGSSGQLRLKVSAHDTRRGQLMNIDRTFRLVLPPGETQEWVNLGVELSLASGVHVLAVGLRDTVSGVTSVVSTTVEIGNQGP